MKTKLRRRAGVEAMTTDGDHEDTRRSGGDDCPEVDSRQREATFHHRAPRWAPVLQSDTLDNQHMKAYKFKVVLLRSDTFNGQHAKGSEFSRSIRKSVTN